MSDTKYTLTGGDGNEYGPFTVQDLKDYFAQKRATLQSQVRKAGSEDQWQPLGQLLEKESREKVNQLTADLSTSNQRLDTSLAFRQGMELFKANMGIMVGACLIYFMLLFAAGLVGSMVPFAQVLVKGPLTGGLYILVLSLIRNQPAQIGDLFEGFKRNYLWLLLINLVQGIILLLAIIPGLLLLAAGGFVAATTVDQTGWIGVPAIVLFSVGSVLTLILGVLAMALVFLPLVLAADKKLNFTEAFTLGWQVSKRNIGPLCKVFLIGVIVMLVASIPCGLGLILAFPWFIAVVIQAYVQLFAVQPAASPDNE